MKKYELMLIINPELKDADRTSLLEEVKKELENLSAKVIKEDLIGTKTLAYKISGSSSGYYVLYELESNKPFDNLMKFFNIKKDVWRNLLVKIED
ncbi:MAG: 30S ribosomal protein S6 [Candidatus Gracilibacteria bacterium]|nr:30S ribosomal protein S6 [Candidatus Gracilibacteria bacterium]